MTKIKATQPWLGVEPGDIFWTTGAGFVGALIRHGTASPYGHVGVVVNVDDPQSWIVEEAMPNSLFWKAGLRRTRRNPQTVADVARIWRTDNERNTIAEVSKTMTNAKMPYAWVEIFAIAASIALPKIPIPRWDNPRTAICSNHVAQCVLAARGKQYIQLTEYPPHRIWPGKLSETLSRLAWHDNLQSLRKATQ